MHDNHVFKASETEVATMERVADVLKADLLLAGCKTVAELCDRKPDVGSVLLGGNYLGPRESLGREPFRASQNSEALMCIVGASYTARCCTVSNGRTMRLNGPVAPNKDRLVLLPHHSTIADLKREHQLHLCRIGQVGTMTAADIQHCGSDTLICRDPDGNILNDSSQLPKASATACADVGCHATFFFDIAPLSMGPKTYIESRLEASPPAIERLRLGPGTLLGLTMILFLLNAI